MQQPAQRAVLPSTPWYCPSKIQQIVIVIIPSPSPLHPYPPSTSTSLPLFILSHSPQELPKLLFRDLVPQIPTPRHHNEPVLNIRSARLFHESDAAKAVGGFGGKDL